MLFWRYVLALNTVITLKGSWFFFFLWRELAGSFMLFGIKNKTFAEGESFVFLKKTEIAKERASITLPQRRVTNLLSCLAEMVLFFNEVKKSLVGREPESKNKNKEK